MTDGDNPQIAAKRLAKLYPAIWQWLGKHADYVAPLGEDYPVMHVRHGTYDKGKPFYDPSLSEAFLKYLDIPATLFKAREALGLIKKTDEPAYTFAALKMRGWTGARIAEVLGQKAWGDDSSKRLVRARLRIMSAVIGLVPESKIRGWGLLAAKLDLQDKARKYLGPGGCAKGSDRYSLLLRSAWQQIVGGCSCEVIFPLPLRPSFQAGDLVWIRRTNDAIAGEARVAGIEPAVFNGQGLPIIGRGQRSIPSLGDIVWIVSLAEGKCLEEAQP